MCMWLLHRLNHSPFFGLGRSLTIPLSNHLIQVQESWKILDDSRVFCSCGSRRLCLPLGHLIFHIGIHITHARWPSSLEDSRVPLMNSNSNSLPSPQVSPCSQPEAPPECPPELWAFAADQAERAATSANARFVCVWNTDQFEPIGWGMV